MMGVPRQTHSVHVVTSSSKAMPGVQGIPHVLGRLEENAQGWVVTQPARDGMTPSGCWVSHHPHHQGLDWAHFHAHPEVPPPGATTWGRHCVTAAHSGEHGDAGVT